MANSKKSDKDLLVLIRKELAAEKKETKRLRQSLSLVKKEFLVQRKEKVKHIAELGVANLELTFQDGEKVKRAKELSIANKELIFQNKEKENRAKELIIANKELSYQNIEKEKRAIELANANYSRSLIEASLDPLFTISPRGKITDMNNASLRVTETSRQNLTGSDFFNYFTEPQKAKEVYKEVFKMGFVTDYPLTLKDKKLTHVLFNGSVYKDEDGNVQGAVVVARDITDQKRVAKELTEAIVSAQLATEMAETAKTKAENAVHIAEDAVRAKQQFLSNMSHEIRTPMNAIIGFTKVLLKTELTAKQKEYLAAIKISGDALIVLINDILDLAKVDSGKLSFEKVPFKMATSVAAMLHLFELKIQEMNLQLVCEYDSNIPEVLMGDSVRLHQIILNLMSNAVKFTAQGSITVRVELLNEDDKQATIQFSVSDTGIGIHPSNLEKIFDTFRQASSGTARLYGGTGLGLAIVKQLVKRQGGRIEVTSKVDKGSTFSFILSFEKTSLPVPAEAELLAPEFKVNNIKVLVVEDIKLNQLLMKTLLDDFGFECDIASNGKIAIERLETKLYDIILMDLQMPEMTGFEATEHIRTKLKLNVPIIALTADVTTVDLDKCTALGMNDYLSKPVDERLLLSKIMGLVNHLGVGKVQINESENIFKTTKDEHCVDLSYLSKRTKSNPVLMMEMITVYLEQTLPLIKTMKRSYLERDWDLLYASVHKMIPSFSIMGIHTHYEQMAKKVQEYATIQQQGDEISALVLKLEAICIQACNELEMEFQRIKQMHHDK